MFYPIDKKIIQIFLLINFAYLESWHEDLVLSHRDKEGSDEPGHPSVQSYPSFAAGMYTQSGQRLAPNFVHACFKSNFTHMQLTLNQPVTIFVVHSLIY